MAKAQAGPLAYQALALEVLHMDSVGLAGQPQGYLVPACSQELSAQSEVPLVMTVLS